MSSPTEPGHCRNPHQLHDAGVGTITDFNKNFDHFDLSGGTFTALSIAPNGDAVLTHGGGAIRIQNPPTLTLAQWNALVVSGMRVAVEPASDDAAYHGPSGHSDIIIDAHHGDWIYI